MFRIRLLFTLTLITSTISAQDASFCSELKSIREIVATSHYQPKTENDSLSKGVFWLFLEQLDEDKRFFLDKDIEIFKNDEFYLDNYFDKEYCNFIDGYAEILQQRIQDSKAYLEKQRNIQLDYSGADSLYYSSEKKYSYFNDEIAAEKYWSKRVRYKILRKLVDNDSVLSNISNNFKQLESELKGKIIDNEICLLTEFEQSKSNIKRFVEISFLDAFLKYQDPNSSYFSTSEKNIFEQSLSNSQLTFGIETAKTKDGDIVIAHISPGSSAFKNGNFEVDDVILSLSNLEETIETYCTSNETILSFLNNSKSNIITFKIKKKNGQIKTIELGKSDIKVEGNSITGFIIKDKTNIGYISIPSFYTDQESINGLGVSNDVAKQIYKLQKEKIEGLILDLRFNGGGSMKEATELSGMFIDRGPVAISRVRGESNYTIKDPNRGSIFNKPIVILVDQFSASASEFFAGAMQDYNRALIVGSTTHGKATSQLIAPIDEGNSPNFIKLTMGQFFRVTGQSHQQTGVVPDIELPSVYDNYKSQEKYKPHGIPNSSTEVTWKHKAKPKKDISTLKNNSLERVLNNKAFNAVIAFNNVFIKEYINRDGVYPLNLQFIFDDNVNYNIAWKTYSDQLEANLPEFSVENTSATDTILGYNEEDRRANELQRKELLTDPYIQEAYYIINDILEL